VKGVARRITGQIFGRESGSNEGLLQNAALARIDAEACFVDPSGQNGTCIPVSR
jgi:hypothetical protein